MACPFTLWVGSNNVIGLQNVVNTLTGDADTNATVLCTVVDTSSVPLTGQVWPAHMAYKVDGDGIPGYYTTLEAGIDITEGTTYLAIIEAIGSASGETGYWEVPVVGDMRRS